MILSFGIILLLGKKFFLSEYKFSNDGKSFKSFLFSIFFTFVTKYIQNKNKSFWKVFFTILICFID